MTRRSGGGGGIWSLLGEWKDECDGLRWSVGSCAGEDEPGFGQESEKENQVSNNKAEEDMNGRKEGRKSEGEVNVRFRLQNSKCSRDCCYERLSTASQKAVALFWLDSSQPRVTQQGARGASCTSPHLHLLNFLPLLIPSHHHPSSPLLFPSLTTLSLFKNEDENLKRNKE